MPQPDGWCCEARVSLCRLPSVPSRGGNGTPWPARGGQEYQEARTRREQVNARMTELELAEREGRLVDAEVVAQTWSGFGVRVRNRILHAPKRLPMVLGHPTRADMAVIDRELREALTESGEGRDATPKRKPTMEVDDYVAAVRAFSDRPTKVRLQIFRQLGELANSGPLSDWDCDLAENQIRAKH